MKTFANDLKIGIISLKQSIANILSSPNELLLDFDLQMLSQFCKKTFYQIHDSIGYLFWYPKVGIKNRVETHNSNWFDFIDSLPIVPHYLATNNGTFVTMKDYLSCAHVINNNSNIITWYLFDYTRPSLQSYLTFYKFYKKMKKTMTDNIIVLENGEYDYPNHTIHIFRCSPDGKHNTRKNCQFEHKTVIELTKNPFIKLYLPVIIGSFDEESSKRMFHLVYRKNIKPKDLFELLVELINILKELQIESIPIHICNSFNFRRILRMLRYLLADDNIKVYVNYKDNHSFFGRKWAFWK
ncbi:uncharacterized protein LOC114883216 [Osmia bicornis bicornis]|uniref:uncharacterized protein LOC114883216 n=1 Tax=Osmia bicornis bicornis TaxID=1437191 RepID=UPI0010F7A217|nr:uncharacterized protein LOC114883216 [Osmia bicornis bicornis]